MRRGTMPAAAIALRFSMLNLARSRRSPVAALPKERETNFTSAMKFASQPISELSVSALHAELGLESQVPMAALPRRKIGSILHSFDLLCLHALKPFSTQV